VNYSAGNVKGLTARVEVLNLDGAIKWEKSAPLDSPEDSVNSCIQMEYPADLTAVHFLRLKLAQGPKVVSENVYWRGTEEANYRAIRRLPKVKLSAAISHERRGDTWQLKVELENLSIAPALMVRLKVIWDRTGDRILPALFSDNYVTLMPGERRTISIEVNSADTRGETPSLSIEGFNVGEVSAS
jgi:hypothetical protein